MKLLEIGGQAVIEGVMFKSKKLVSIAVRNEKKEIVKEKEEFISLLDKKPFLNIFLIRGVINLYEMLVLGMKTLNRSLVLYGEEVDSKDSLLTTIISIIFAVGIFVGIPFLISKLLTNNFFYFNLIEGLIRIIIFIGYLLIISMIPDVRRIFQYHGAEHMTINCYENLKDHKKVSVKNCLDFSTLHPRCGTSFLFFVLIVSIFVFSLFNVSNVFIKLLLRIILLPLIAGLSYEVLKLSAKFSNNILVKLVILPGLLIQRITTKKPDEEQLEVAIESFKLHFNNSSVKEDIDNKKYKK